MRPVLLIPLLCSIGFAFTADNEFLPDFSDKDKQSQAVFGMVVAAATYGTCEGLEPEMSPLRKSLYAFGSSVVAGLLHEYVYNKYITKEDVEPADVVAVSIGGAVAVITLEWKF